MKTKNSIRVKASPTPLLFLKSLLQNPSEIGQVTPSSRFLAERMVSKLDLAKARVVVEFGPGTGAVTAAIIPKLGKKTAFFALESNVNMVTILRQRFSQIEVVHDSAERINHYLQKYNLPEADYIISSLPFALLSPQVRQSIIANSYQALRPGGAFVAYQYIHASLLKNAVTTREQLRGIFRQIDSSIILRNIPPAFVFQCFK